MRRGTDFLCFAKESQQRKATPASASATPIPSLRTIGKAAGFNKTEPAETPCRIWTPPDLQTQSFFGYGSTAHVYSAFLLSLFTLAIMDYSRSRFNIACSCLRHCGKA
jgi:hypothetical protein